MLQNHLQEVFIDKAGKLRGEGAKQIFEAESLLTRGEELIRLWFGSEEVDNFRARLHQLRERLEEDRLEQVARLSKALNSDLREKLKAAETNELKHQNRRYILKALRQVASDMGFKEVGKPHFATPDDRGSRIVLTVDTINRGVVTFYLSLKGVEVDSCISQTYCFEEFEKLSKQLTDKFGVVTMFKLGEEPTGKLKQKGALEEPTGELKRKGEPEEPTGEAIGSSLAAG
jgi:hypothetical protein